MGDYTEGIIVILLILILSIPIVPFTIEEVYNETIPIKEYEQYIELVPIVKEECKNDPVRFFKELGEESGKRGIEGAIAGSVVPQLGTAAGGLAGVLSGVYAASKENIQRSIEQGNVFALTEYCEQMEELIEIERTKEITTFVTLPKTRTVTNYKSGWCYLIDKIF